MWGERRAFALRSFGCTPPYSRLSSSDSACALCARDTQEWYRNGERRVSEEKKEMQRRREWRRRREGRGRR